MMMASSVLVGVSKTSYEYKSPNLMYHLELSIQIYLAHTINFTDDDVRGSGPLHFSTSKLIFGLVE